MNMQVFAIKLTTVLALLLAAIGVAQAAGVDDGFRAEANSSVQSIAIQDDGKIILGGGFGTISGQSRVRLARLLPNGEIDPSFAATEANQKSPPRSCSRIDRSARPLFHWGGYVRTQPHRATECRRRR